LVERLMRPRDTAKLYGNTRFWNSKWWVSNVSCHPMRHSLTDTSVSSRLHLASLNLLNLVQNFIIVRITFHFIAVIVRFLNDGHDIGFF
jgi:hypothetical protein